MQTSTTHPKKVLENIITIDITLNNKIEMSKVIKLKDLFFDSKIAMKGDLTKIVTANEFIKINSIEFSNLELYNEEYYPNEYRTQLEEVVLCAPDILLDLLNIDKKSKDKDSKLVKFSEDLVISYFNLEKFSLVWDEEIEISYDNFMFKKNITKSNLIKKNNFLISLDHQRQLKRIFLDKYLVKYEDYEYNMLESQI